VNVATLDVGSVAYNDRTYPDFTRLLHELRAETQPSEVRFSLRDEARGLERRAAGP